MANIEAMIKELPQDLQQEVEDFVQFLRSLIWTLTMPISMMWCDNSVLFL